MKILKNLFPVLILISLFGCASFHYGEIANDKIVLQNANFNYIKTNLVGTSEVFYFLGIGGNDTDSLIDEAKKDLMSKNPLGPNQALANMSITYKYSFNLGIVFKRHCIITADVIEFKNSKN